MATAEPTRQYTDEQLDSDAVSKKDLVQSLQEVGSIKFLLEHKLKGNIKNVVKTKSKEQLVEHYNELFTTKAFKQEGEEEKEQGKGDDKKLVEKTKKLSVKDDDDEPPKYQRRILKRGDRTNFPRKGDTVACFYTGKLEDGTVFDQNAISTKKYKKAQPLRFKVGIGTVIKGWDHALLTMSAGEKIELTIQPEWGYGKKGLEGKVPPNATLIFEVELVTIE